MHWEATKDEKIHLFEGHRKGGETEAHSVDHTCSGRDCEGEDRPKKDRGMNRFSLRIQDI